MNRYISGSASSGMISNGEIAKTTLRHFSSDEAQSYAETTKQYDQALRESGYNIPQLFSCEAEWHEWGDWVVVQRSVYIEGAILNGTLPEEARIAALHRAMGMIASAPTDRYGNLLTPVDAKPSNFVTEDETTYLVDTLPPLMRNQNGEFPYRYVMPSPLPFRKDWIDRFIISKSGALARLTMMTVPQWSEDQPRLYSTLHAQFNELLSAWDEGREGEQLKREIRRKVLSFVAFTHLCGSPSIFY